MAAIILDVETLSQPPEVVLANLPAWDIEEAKTRVPKNYKKEEAINGWLDEDKANWGKDALEKAALNPETATVAIFGMWRNGEVEQAVVRDDGKVIEDVILATAVRWISESKGPVLGWNLKGFDIPFLVRRCWMTGIRVPSSIYNPLSRYPIPDRFTDMMDAWKVGSWKSPHTSLNNAMRAMGLPGKPDGKEFAKLWATDRAAALEYSRAELIGQSQLYRRMGVEL